MLNNSQFGNKSAVKILIKIQYDFFLGGNWSKKMRSWILILDLNDQQGSVLTYFKIKHFLSLYTNNLILFPHFSQCYTQRCDFYSIY